MEKYRNSKLYLLNLVGALIFATFLIVKINNLHSRIMFSIGIIYGLYTLFVMYHKVYIVTDTGLLIKNRFREYEVIRWSNVVEIKRMKLKYGAVIVRTSKENFIINSNIKNYKQMIETIVNYCSNNENVKLER